MRLYCIVTFCNPRYSMWCLFRLIFFSCSSEAKISSRGIPKGGSDKCLISSRNYKHGHSSNGGFRNPWNPPLATPLRKSPCIFFYYTVSGPPCTVYTYWDILTEKIWQIFIRKWVLTNQRSERCFSHVKKRKVQWQSRTMFFSSVRKMIRLIKSHRGVWVSHPDPAFYKRLQLAAPSLCELLRSHLTRKDNNGEFFL